MLRAIPLLQTQSRNDSQAEMMDPLQTRPPEPGVLIPAGHQFASLELAMAPGRDHLLFARNVLRKMCIHHGMDPDLALSTSENSRAAILRLYADHRSSGGRPHLIVEQMLVRQSGDNIILAPADAPQLPHEPTAPAFSWRQQPIAGLLQKYRGVVRAMMRKLVDLRLLSVYLARKPNRQEESVGVEKQAHELEKRIESFIQIEPRQFEHLQRELDSEFDRRDEANKDKP